MVVAEDRFIFCQAAVIVFTLGRFFLTDGPRKTGTEPGASSSALSAAQAKGSVGVWPCSEGAYGIEDSGAL